MGNEYLLLFFKILLLVIEFTFVIKMLSLFVIQLN